jgi:broad specificity phosphatase PhoE
MSHVLLLRHSESTFNAEGRWAGWLDAPLTTFGRGQACDAARNLVGQGYQGIVTSDLARASEGGFILAHLLRLPVVAVDGRWRERHAGAWQGRLLSELPPERLQEWRENPTQDVPDGETYTDFLSRISCALHDAQKWARQWGPLIVVAHDGVQQALCREMSLPYPYSPLEGPVIPA